MPCSVQRREARVPVLTPHVRVSVSLRVIHIRVEHALPKVWLGPTTGRRVGASWTDQHLQDGSASATKAHSVNTPCSLTSGPRQHRPAARQSGRARVICKRVSGGRCRASKDLCARLNRCKRGVARVLSPHKRAASRGAPTPSIGVHALGPAPPCCDGARAALGRAARTALTERGAGLGAAPTDAGVAIAAQTTRWLRDGTLAPLRAALRAAAG